nr:putative lysine-specific demethylase JMJ16 [Tanacetum cinerariifolium]
MGTEFISHYVKEESINIPLIPPGFESFMPFRINESRHASTSSVSTSVISEPGLMSHSGKKIRRSSRRRSGTNYKISDCISEDEPDHKPLDQINHASRFQLTKGVIRGYEKCNNCQKVTAKWHPEEARVPNLSEAPVFYPTEEEFEDTLKYISSIRDKAEAYGICRIVPPSSWKLPCRLKEKAAWENSGFLTRIQRIDKLQNRDSLRKLPNDHKKKKRRRYIKKGAAHKTDNGSSVDEPMVFESVFGFEPGPTFTLDEFKKYADDFKAQYFRKNEGDRDLGDQWEPSVENIEGEFWRIVEKPTEEIEVLYGADVETCTFGSGFPSAQSQVTGSDEKYVRSGWNLNSIPKLQGSLLTYESSDISGVLVPWLYIGMCFSSFCWHVEDHNLYSISYMHCGAPKMWYGVAGKDALKFEAAMRKKLPDLFAAQPDLLHKLVTQLSPTILNSEGVPVYRCIQNPGDFVLTFPRSYHSGFNCGFNCAEAVNVAPVDWLPHGHTAVELYREQGRKTSISHDKLLLGAARDAAKAQWEMNLLRKNTPETLTWKFLCGKDGVLTKALKDRVEMERVRRDFLCKTSQSLKMEATFDSTNERECSVCYFDLHLSAAGFRSRVKYLNILDPSNVCYYISEILDAERDRPMFMVSLENWPSEAFIHLSADKCWEMVRERINQEISKRRKLGISKLLPLQRLGSLNGMKMFGFSSPFILQGIQSMDGHHVSKEYWRSRGFNTLSKDVCRSPVNTQDHDNPNANEELLSAIVVLLPIRGGRIIGAFIVLMDENTVRLWLKEQQDAVEKLAQQQATAFQLQFDALRAELHATGGLHQGRHGGGGEPGLPRSMRLDVSKFTGVDPERWLFSINEYFSLPNTPADQRLRIVGCNLEEAATEWFRWMTRNGLVTDWARFEESVKNRFGPSKVTGISETLLISFYISGLKLSLQHELLVLNPTTLGHAFSLSRVTKARLDDETTPAVVPKVASHGGGSLYQRPGAKLTELSTSPTVVVNSSKPLAIKWISPMERQECLCFNCNNRWTRGHKCTGKLLLLMTENDEDTAPIHCNCGGLDVVLGIQWLQQLGKVTHDYEQQVMEFTLLDTTYTLKGDESLRMKKISLHQMQALLEKEDVYGMYECQAFLCMTKKYVRKLMRFDFSMEYKPGTTNRAGYALSRMFEEDQQLTASFMALIQSLLGFVGDFQGIEAQGLVATKFHDTLSAGHGGIKKTLVGLSALFFGKDCVNRWRSSLRSVWCVNKSKTQPKHFVVIYNPCRRLQRYGRMYLWTSCSTSKPVLAYLITKRPLGKLAMTLLVWNVPRVLSIDLLDPTLDRSLLPVKDGE